MIRTDRQRQTTDREELFQNKYFVCRCCGMGNRSKRN